MGEGVDGCQVITPAEMLDVQVDLFDQDRTGSQSRDSASRPLRRSDDVADNLDDLAPKQAGQGDNIGPTAGVIRPC